MLCPNCGKSNPDDKDFCELCGAALVGPKSMILNESNSDNKIDKDNISSITGIDLNKISQSTSAFSDFNISLADTNGNTGKKKKRKIDLKFILLIVLLIIVFGLSFYVMKVGKKTCPSSQGTGNNYRITSTNYSFVIPSGYEYNDQSFTGNLLIRSQDVELIFYPLGNGNIDKISIDDLKNKYSQYEEASGKEVTFNGKKAYIISYSSNNNYYIDFYFQFMDGKILYGQGKSSDKDKVNSDEIQNIIGSFGTRPGMNNFSYSASGSNQSNIVSSFN